MTSAEVAERVAEQVEEHGSLGQQEAAHHLPETFGDGFVCRDKNGDPGIARSVLGRFREITGGPVVWVHDQSEWLLGCWRPREPEDGPGRRQFVC